MTDLVALLLGVVLVDEFVLARHPALFPPANPGGAVAAVTVGALTLAAPAAWLVHHRGLVPIGLADLGLLAWVLATTLAVRAMTVAAAAWRPRWADTLEAQRPRLGFDAVAAGVAVYVTLAPDSLPVAVAAGFVAGLLLASLRVAHTALRRRVDAGDVPPRWRGPAIALVTAAIVSLASAGMAGLWPG
ncbi:MAG: hypothetical protein IT486_06205 [Gammaproteobacteria bacterium]|nr:hypothetical protein [Gammaproteobacteria bacterium]